MAGIISVGGTHLLSQESHGKGLVQQPQLPALALPIVGVPEDSSIKQSPVDIGNH